MVSVSAVLISSLLFSGVNLSQNSFSDILSSKAFAANEKENLNEKTDWQNKYKKTDVQASNSEEESTNKNNDGNEKESSVSTKTREKNSDESNIVCCSSKDIKIHSGSGDDLNIAFDAGKDIKISSGGGFDSNAAGFAGEDNKISSGGVDDINSIADSQTGKVNCGWDDDTVTLENSPDVKISKNLRNCSDNTLTLFIIFITTTLILNPNQNS